MIIEFLPAKKEDCPVIRAVSDSLLMISYRQSSRISPEKAYSFLAGSAGNERVRCGYL